MVIFNLNDMSTNDKDKLIDFFEKQLVKQAINQHYENDKEVLQKGAVTDYSINREHEHLIVTFENGEKWQYSCIDCGAEGMLYHQVDENDD